MRRVSRRRRRQAKNAVVSLLHELPHFLGLLLRLFRDPRVSALDKALVGLVIGYIVTPIDLLPDFVYALGLVDDLYLLALALNRLLLRAGPDLLVEHWHGRPGALLALLDGLEEIGAILPRSIRRVLRGAV